MPHTLASGEIIVRQLRHGMPAVSIFASWTTAARPPMRGSESRRGSGPGESSARAAALAHLRRGRGGGSGFTGWGNSALRVMRGFLSLCGRHRHTLNGVAFVHHRRPFRKAFLGSVGD